MVDLAPEKLVELIVNEIDSLLSRKNYKCTVDKKGPYSGVDLNDEFNKKIGKLNLAVKYVLISELVEGSEGVTNQQKKELKMVVNAVLDKSTRDTFMNYIILNRNEVAHCNEIKKENTEVLL